MAHLMARRRAIQTIALTTAAIFAVGCAQASQPAPTATAEPAPTTPPAPTATSAPAAAAPQAASPVAGAASPAANPAERDDGTIQSVDNGMVTLSDGKTFSVASKTRVIRTESITAGDLKTGDYVAVTAKRQPDNTLLASIVNVFPPSRKGVGVGQRPMTGGNLMTNATIDKIDGDAFTVTFPGGGAQVKLASNAQVNRFADASASDLKAGMKVSALVQQGTAQSISIQ